MTLKPYSDKTNEVIDEEVRKIALDCYERTKEILVEKKDLIEALAEELLAKETISLPDIIRILGDRPYGLKENVKEYLEELKEREEKEKMEEKLKAENEEQDKEGSEDDKTESTEEDESKSEDKKEEKESKDK